jgi:5-methylcytosine-specific restriction endonuclease McrA
VGKLGECLADLKALRTKYGTSIYDDAVKKINRERLQDGAERKRRAYPRRVRVDLYLKQNALCPICDERMDANLRLLHVDHIDPDRQDWNHSSNLQLVHASCNLHKSSKSLQQQSKESGRTVADILEVE